MYKLQSLRIPPGWEVVINKFLDVEVAECSVKDKIWDDLTEDILYLRRRSKKLVVSIDLGWYPDTDPAGNFVIKVLLNEDWQKPIEEFKSRNTKEAVLKIEEFLLKYCSDYKVRKNLPNQEEKCN